MNNLEEIFKAEGMSSQLVERFQEVIYQHYRANKRKLPWRETSDPYRILVSETMLQQTQVGRVAEKYEPFIAAFPDFTSLAEAHFREILAKWHGLGYNRRAVALHQTARKVLSEFGGALPNSIQTLMTLPGIGKATAGALMAFAHHSPAVFIETNIRRVFIHFFFADRSSIKDEEILPLVEATLDEESIRDWYYALMDYGAMLKTLKHNPNRRSAHHHVQAPFEHSDRQIRGLILGALVTKPFLSERELVESVGKARDRVLRLAGGLIEEGFLERKGKTLCISAGSPSH